MSTTQTELLDQALGLTHRMLENAQAGDWQAVIAQECERRRLLERAFATRQPLNAAQAVSVRRILDLDKGLLEISTQLRDGIGDELGQLQKGNRASQAYRANIA